VGGKRSPEIFEMFSGCAGKDVPKAAGGMQQKKLLNR